MTPGARIQAAIDILTGLVETAGPADEAVKSWGRQNRFAGSKDRAAIRHLVLSSYRVKGEAGGILGGDSPRNQVLGALRFALGWQADEIDQAMTGNAYDAKPLNPEEKRTLETASPSPAPGKANWPAWLAEQIEVDYGAAAEELMASLLRPGPLDVRVNPSKAERQSVLAALSAVGYDVHAAPFSPIGLRVARDDQMGGANLRALPIFKSGDIEIQDEGSQLAGLLAAAKPGETIVDLCAGGGGKTMVLIAQMQGRGQLLACDVNETRLRAGAERVRRAGLEGVEHQLIDSWTPDTVETDPNLEAFENKADCVVLDVPCSGSGAWRRQPEAKWRFDRETLNRLLETQRSILDRGARLVRPGGRLIYITCSVLGVENQTQVQGFLSRSSFRQIPLAPAFENLTGKPFPGIDGHGGLQLTPLNTQTDGFFVAQLEKPE